MGPIWSTLRWSGGREYAARCETLDSSCKRVVTMTEVYAVDLTAAAPEWQEGKKWHWKEQVMYTFPQNWGPLLRQPLSAMQWRVLMALVHYCEWGNKCRVSGAQLGRDLGVHRSTVFRTLRSLVPYQLLILETSPRQSEQTIVLSPLLCWKGRPWHLSYARSQFLAAWRLRYATDSVPVAPTASRHTAPAAVRP